ncbi:MAG TPA: MerR family transcriptional regulator [Chthoniobacteraceae bacterium]|nr:MerR family transcriptional regulator [Chthoniobacteraceae bacterium]
MNESYSISDLAAAVNQWCAGHGITPASGQAGEEVTERNIRYYRTIGLLDAPERGGDGFTEKHRLQLVAIRILQSQGLPLRRIRELLFGRSIPELREVQKRGLAESKRTQPAFHFPTATSTGAGDELWRMIPLDADFMLVSRTGATLSAGQRLAILSILNAHEKTPVKQR